MLWAGVRSLNPLPIARPTVASSRVSARMYQPSENAGATSAPTGSRGGGSRISAISAVARSPGLPAPDLPSSDRASSAGRASTAFGSFARPGAGLVAEVALGRLGHVRVRPCERDDRVPERPALVAIADVRADPSELSPGRVRRARVRTRERDAAQTRERRQIARVVGRVLVLARDELRRPLVIAELAH